MHPFLLILPAVWMFCMALIPRIAAHRHATKLKQLAEDNSLLVRLYWQRPLASQQANRWLYGLFAIPPLIFLALSIARPFIEGAAHAGSSAFMIFSAAAWLCIIDQYRGPGFFYISSRGIYWSQAITCSLFMGGEVFPWNKILSYRWKRIAGQDFFCFTPERDDKQFKTETRLGPFTAGERAKIDAVLDLHAAETAAVTMESL